MSLSPIWQLSLPFWARTLYTVLLLHPNPDTQTFLLHYRWHPSRSSYPLKRTWRKALATTSHSPHLLHVAGEDYSVTSDLSSSRERTSQMKARSLQLQICWLGWWHSAGYLLGWHHNPSVLPPPPQSCSLGLNETGKRRCWLHCRKMAAAVPPTYMTKYWNFWDLWSLLYISSSISPFLLGKQFAAVSVSLLLGDYITRCGSWFCLRR